MKRLLQTTLGLGLLPGFGLAQQPIARPVIPVPTQNPAQPPATAPASQPQSTPVNPAATMSPADGSTAPPPAATGTPATPTASGAATPTRPANLPAVSPSYVIGPEDAIVVNVWKEPSISGSYSVRPDGMISLPLLGDLPASGMTPSALGSDIATRLKKYLTDPLVTVTVTAVNSQHYYMVGEVGHAGVLPLTPGMTPLQAIAAAGGLSPYANAKHIYILHADKGKQVKIPFNYKKAVKDGDMQGVTLASGDTIVVP